jgi:hypothetical protein
LSTRGNLVEKAELLLYNINMLHGLHDQGALPKRERLEPTLLPTEAVEFKNATEASGAATIRRSVFERFGVFDEALQTGEDTEFGRRLAKGGIRPYLLPTIRVEVAFRNKLSRDRNLVFGSRSRTSPSRFGFGAETDFRPALSEFAESPSGCQRRFGLLSLVRARFGLPGGRAGRQEARTGRLRSIH